MLNVLLEYIDLFKLWHHKQIEILERAACTCNYYSILLLSLDIRVHLCDLFSLTTFVNMMYLQITNQREALQMQKND